MRLNNILIMGIVSMSIMGTANAAIYGTLKTEIETKSKAAEVVLAQGEEALVDEAVLTLQKGELVKIVAKQEDEYIIEIDEEIKQAVDSEAIDLVGKLTYTAADDTRLRQEASPEADIIDFLKRGELILVLERQDDFYKVKTQDKEGYIYKTQLDETGLSSLPYFKTEAEAVSTESGRVKAESTYIGEEVVDYARQFLGGRYVFGGNSLTRGVDCSGFTQQIMKRFGVQIERSSRAQFASNGYKVSEKELLPGDLVFYGSNGKTIDHVAIYAGNGQIIHASDAKSGIKMSALYYGKPIIGMKRVLS